jgi:hypothetical protein
MFNAFRVSCKNLSNPLCLYYTTICSGRLLRSVLWTPNAFTGRALFARSSSGSAKPFRSTQTCKLFPNSLYWMCCKSFAPGTRAPQKFRGLLRRRGHVLNGNPA